MNPDSATPTRSGPPLTIRGFKAPRPRNRGLDAFHGKMRGIKPGLTIANPTPDRMRFDVLMHGLPIARVVCDETGDGVTVIYYQAGRARTLHAPTMEPVSITFAALTWAVMPGMSINRMTELLLNEYRNQLDLIELVGA